MKSRIDFDKADEAEIVGALAVRGRRGHNRQPAPSVSEGALQQLQEAPFKRQQETAMLRRIEIVIDTNVIGIRLAQIRT
ncbi:MAG: hypothetical protein HY360_08945 [Verrucomicrobia bacterium]|nr:hypothetical protein [Verrucomicrobiota bacterium]